MLVRYATVLYIFCHAIIKQYANDKMTISDRQAICVAVTENHYRICIAHNATQSSSITASCCITALTDGPRARLKNFPQAALRMQRARLDTYQSTWVKNRRFC